MLDNYFETFARLIGEIMNHTITLLSLFSLALFLIMCTTVPASTPRYDAIVDANYSGAEGARVNGVKTFRRVATVLDDAPVDSTKPYVIFIKHGRYYEKLDIVKPFIAFLGESRGKTILTYDAASDTKKPDGTTWGTSGSASITIRAPDFRAENLTIENGFDYPGNAAKANTDPTRIANAQAVALKTDKGSQRAVFKNISLIGYQDTLYADSGTHYFSQCSISGNVDFIFGAGQAVFDDCDIISRSRQCDEQRLHHRCEHSARPAVRIFVHPRAPEKRKSWDGGWQRDAGSPLASHDQLARRHARHRSKRRRERGVHPLLDGCAHRRAGLGCDEGAGQGRQHAHVPTRRCAFVRIWQHRSRRDKKQRAQVII